jgi:hypothetical protein
VAEPVEDVAVSEAEPAEDVAMAEAERLSLLKTSSVGAVISRTHLDQWHVLDR